MLLTGKREGFFSRAIVIEQGGLRQGLLRVRGFVSTLQLENGPRHEFCVVPEAGRLSLYWRSEGTDIVAVPLLARNSFAEGFVCQGVRYGVVKSAERVFDISADGKKYGVLSHTGGFFSSDFTLETARDIPVEAAAFLFFLTLAYPVLRLL